MSESTTNRRRQAEFTEELDSRREDWVAGCPVRLVKTVTVGTYPATAQAYFGVQALRPGGDQKEGAAVTTTVTSRVFFAANTGTVKPPSGTIGIIVTFTGGRWVFRYDG